MNFKHTWNGETIEYFASERKCCFGLDSVWIPCLEKPAQVEAEQKSLAEVDLLTLIIIFCLENSAHCCYFFFLINPYDNSMALIFFISILHKGDVCNHADSNQ